MWKCSNVVRITICLFLYTLICTSEPHQIIIYSILLDVFSLSLCFPFTISLCFLFTIERLFTILLKYLLYYPPIQRKQNKNILWMKLLYCFLISYFSMYFKCCFSYRNIYRWAKGGEGLQFLFVLLGGGWFKIKIRIIKGGKNLMKIVSPLTSNNQLIEIDFIHNKLNGHSDNEMTNHSTLI